MKKITPTKIVKQGTATQSCNENEKNNYEAAKKVAIYLVHVNNKDSELADFALFSGVTSASLVENATNGTVSARVTQEAIVLEERASGYEIAFMKKFIADSRHEERLVEDIAFFICKAMGEIKQEPTKEDAPKKDNTDIVVNTTDVIDVTVINDFNSTFATSESKILNYMSEVSDFKTRKLRLYSKTCEYLFDAGYKGDKHKDKVLTLLTPENRSRYDELLSLAV